MSKKRLIAYYLPQFHEIKENNEWWGKGYTEWTAIKNWKPFFRNHIIRKPGVLGYYDLLEAEDTINLQYNIASKYGIEGFCFWIYWFGNGERLLEKPLLYLLKPENKVKFCFAWANHSWVDKSNNRVLKEQKYLGSGDYEEFYRVHAEYFCSDNYIKKDNKLLLTVFMPQSIPDLQVFMDTLNKMAIKDGFDGFYFISNLSNLPLDTLNKFDAYMSTELFFKNRNLFQKIRERLIKRYSCSFLGLVKYSYPKLMNNLFICKQNDERFIPNIFSGWDTTPRHKERGVILTDFNENTFEKHVIEIFNLKNVNDFVFIKSWNEWAEGNLIEPDDIFGEKLLEIIKKNN